jgi:UDP-4-amino-4,6-dideoxy-N-acetyl-beta-L-altrosamine transaminase
MIPYGKQDITKEDIRGVIKILRSDFLTQGPTIHKFENALCDYTGAKYSVVTNNCTSALHLACLALDLNSKDILWTSPITFVASANCALYCGATVDFVDINPDTALISIESLKEKLEKADKENKLPKIVIPVHFAGQPCDMEIIYNLSKQYGFKIIEDAAHAIGASYKNKKIGNCKYSDITVFSFHPVKIITTGEGGAAMTNNKILADKMELMRSHGITRNQHNMNKKLCNNWYYEQIDLGFNYRMTDIQAALGISQLNRLDEYVQKRKKIAKLYDKLLNNTSINPLVQSKDRSSAYHLYVVRLKYKENYRDIVYNHLHYHGINANFHYIPIYRMPYYGLKHYKNRFKNAESYYSSAITLPLFPGLSFQDVNFVVDRLCDTHNV